jgi:hypothetical protein
MRTAMEQKLKYFGDFAGPIPNYLDSDLIISMISKEQSDEERKQYSDYLAGGDVFSTTFDENGILCGAVIRQRPCAIGGHLCTVLDSFLFSSHIMGHHSDGVWAWPSDLAHYVYWHHLELPNEFKNHIDSKKTNSHTITEDFASYVEIMRPINSAIPNNFPYQYQKDVSEFLDFRTSIEKWAYRVIESALKHKDYYLVTGLIEAMEQDEIWDYRYDSEEIQVRRLLQIRADTIRRAKKRLDMETYRSEIKMLKREASEAKEKNKMNIYNTIKEFLHDKYQINID